MSHVSILFLDSGNGYVAFKKKIFGISKDQNVGKRLFIEDGAMPLLELHPMLHSLGFPRSFLYSLQ